MTFRLPRFGYGDAHHLYTLPWHIRQEADTPYFPRTRTTYPARPLRWPPPPSLITIFSISIGMTTTKTLTHILELENPAVAECFVRCLALQSPNHSFTIVLKQVCNSTFEIVASRGKHQSCSEDCDVEAHGIEILVEECLLSKEKQAAFMSRQGREAQSALNVMQKVRPSRNELQRECAHRTLVLDAREG